MIFLKAYQAYKKHNFDLSLKLLQELKQTDIKRRELEAQIYFLKKEFQKSYDIYKDLLEKANNDNAKEYEDNILAIIVAAQLEQPGLLKTKAKDKLPSQDEIVDQVEIVDLKDAQTWDLFSKSSHSKQTNKRRKRKIRLPKQYDPNVAPDPERWIPRRDRKGGNYKQKKRRQRPNQNKKR